MTTKKNLEDGLTNKGTTYLSYDEFRALQAAARTAGLVLQFVEAFEPGRTIPMRMDATFSFPHSEYSEDWSETVRQSSEFADEVLSTVPDRDALQYQVWLDAKEEGDDVGGCV